jgi:hypothetical protein
VLANAGGGVDDDNREEIGHEVQNRLYVIGTDVFGLDQRIWGRQDKRT